MKKYYEALNKKHDIVRFWADSDDTAIIIARSMRHLGLVRISYKSLKILKTILPYKDSGY